MNKYFVLSARTKINCCVPATNPILNAMHILERDIEKTLTSISDTFASNEINLEYTGATVAAEPETFAIHFAKLKNGEDKLVVAGADELGLIYGILFLSREYLHIPAFWFWNDFVPEPKESVRIPLKEYASKPYHVRYRGWFVNDEVLILGWHKTKYEKSVWQPIFEALLRCGGNMVIPGTGTTAFEEEQLASDMGLYLTHHHAEPLGSEMFSSAYPDKDPNYQKNSALFEKLWEKGILRQKDKKVIWTLGFRGQGDRPFWKDDPSYVTPAERGKLISDIIRKQYDLVSLYVKDPVCCTNLYGEIMQLYRDGHIMLPDGVIKIWADSGYGKMVSRRQGNSNPRVCALPYKGDTGPHGLYYHVTFHDLQASNHLTMGPNSPEMIKSELEKAFSAGADNYMILNCGNVRPHVYMLDFIAEIWKNGQADVDSHLESFTDTYYHSCHKDVARGYKCYFKSVIQYGKNDDERAGEQFYHYPARIIVSHWMQGNINTTAEQLVWATGTIDFVSQIKWFAEKYAVGKESWNRTQNLYSDMYLKLSSTDRQVFSDNLILQATLHETGCEGGLELCKSFFAFQDKNYFQAYLHACAAMEAYKKGLSAMKDAEHDKWNHFYKNDCLTSVKLTVYSIDSLRRYLRVLGDGTEFLNWEKEYLYPESQKRIMLETTYTNQLTDDELYNQLKKAKNLMET